MSHAGKKGPRFTPDKILAVLEKMHPEAKIELRYSNPMELIVAVILSAQCTDKRVNMVTETLFRKYGTAADYANVAQEELGRDIKSTGFYNSKAKNIIGMAKMLVEKFGGQVPRKMDELIELPGVARKTANVVLAGAFGIAEGMAVDTHVKRVSNRLGLTKEEDPVKIEQDLMKFFPREKWSRATDLLIFLGRYTCMAKRPGCEKCLLSADCPSSLV
jgi:endonuclease-3